MKKIPLTKGFFAIVDNEDYEVVNQYKWCVKLPNKSSKNYYAKRQAFVNNKPKTFYMHHLIIGNPPEGHETDHKNGNGLDNRRKNLQHVTHRKNLQNLHGEYTSKYPGVSWCNRSQRWQVGIRVGGKRLWLGYATNEKQAAKMYREACRELL